MECYEAKKLYSKCIKECSLQGNGHFIHYNMLSECTRLKKIVKNLCYENNKKSN